MTRRHSQSRAGTILPLLAVSTVAIFGFVAFAIDIGMVALARCQCQNAADCSALAGARTLSGDPLNNNNFGNCEPGARKAASANLVLGKSINGNDPQVVKIEIGSYTFDPSSNTFVEMIPKATTDNYSLVRSTVNSNGNNTAFAKIFGINTFNTSATATAAHRPRDVCVIMDFSGSMRFASLMGVPYNGTRNNGGAAASGSNNPETIYPQFGHYSSATAGLQQSNTSVTIGTDFYDASNVTAPVAGNDYRPAIVRDFYQNAAYVDPDIPAFNNDGVTGDNGGNLGNGNGPKPPADATLLADKLAAGDRPLKITNNTGATYAQTIQGVTGSTTTNSGFETNGYQQFTGTAFSGYTQGPRYWGKTFFIWPPNPTNDWRSKFFGTTDNTKLWDSSGNWKTPAGNYTINYTAILDWIKNTGYNPFPTQLRAGHIKYYSSIPTTISTASFPPSNTDQRFWKEYIDNALGLRETSSGSWTNVIANSGYGPDFTWGTVAITAKPSGKYMSYTDNPKRPRTNFWFGPMTMVDFMSNYNLLSVDANYDFMWPGTCHEAPLYACKLGIRASIDDMKNNHPNDFISLSFFGVPRSSSTDGNADHRFNAVRGPLSRNYNYMKQSLWFPQSTLNADGTDNNTEITPYDLNNNPPVPRAGGGTCFPIGLMLAYNQFQSTPTTDTTLRKWITPSASVPEGLAGGMGRKGAQKMVIFETDGLPNTDATATLQTSGSISYYKIRFNQANLAGSEYPSVTSTTDNAASLVTHILSLVDSLNTAYSTPRKPLRLHTIGFGPLYDATSSQKSAALDTLQKMQYHGNTQSSASTPLDSFKIVTGDDLTLVTNLQKAMSTIMQGSIQVVLLD